jgi:hypothetical protein
VETCYCYRPHQPCDKRNPLQCPVPFCLTRYPYHYPKLSKVINAHPRTSTNSSWYRPRIPRDPNLLSRTAISDYSNPGNPGPCGPSPALLSSLLTQQKDTGKISEWTETETSPPSLNLPISGRGRAISAISRNAAASAREAKAKVEKKSASATRRAKRASSRLRSAAESLSEAPPVDPMEASTQDKIVGLSPTITSAVRVKADRLAKPQELHAHTNPINASLLANYLQLPPTAPTSPIQPNIMRLLRKSEPNKEKNSRNYLPSPSPLHLIYTPRTQ